MAESRFDFSDQYAMRVIDDGNFLAFFNFVDTELGLEFKDFKLMDGKNGVFASSPSREYENKDGETKYSNYVQPHYDFDENVRDEYGTAYFDELAEAAFAEFERRRDDEGSSKKKKSSGRKSGGKSNGKRSSKSSGKRSSGKRSGRGPVDDAPTVDEDDGLPF